MYNKWIWHVPERWKHDTTQKNFTESINHLAWIEMLHPAAFLPFYKDSELPLAVVGLNYNSDMVL